MIYNTSASSRPYNSDDGQLYQTLLELGCSPSYSKDLNFSFVAALRSSTGDILVLCASRLILLIKGITSGSMVIDLNCCLGALLEIKMSDPNPTLFRASTSQTESFSDLFGNCACRECYNFYNTVLPSRQITSAINLEESGGVQRGTSSYIRRIVKTGDRQFVKVEVIVMDKMGHPRSIQVN